MFLVATRAIVKARMIAARPGKYTVSDGVVRVPAIAYAMICKKCKLAGSILAFVLFFAFKSSPGRRLRCAEYL